MKRLHIVVALLLVTLLLSACGAAPEAVTPAEEETAVETAAPVETAEESAPAPQKATATPEEPAISEETTAAPRQEPASALQPETSATTSAPSSGGTSGGGSGNSGAPIIGVIGSGGQSSGGTDQPQSSSGVVGVIGGQQNVHIHSYSRQVVAPTCSEGGYTIFTCSCGESYTGDYTSATGQHRWVMDYDYVPVYEERGIHICNVCGKDITDMTLEQHYFGDGCLGSWRSATIQVEVGTSYEVVGCHCGDCGKVAGE